MYVVSVSVHLGATRLMRQKFSINVGCVLYSMTMHWKS
jgi:hypothetical protein